MLEFISNLQEFLNKLTAYPLIYYPIHFLISSLVSYYSLPVIWTKVRTFDDLLKYLTNLSKQDEKIKREIRNFKRQFALLTGLASTAIIAFQFRGLSINSAILYGFLGVYFLRDQIISSLRRKAAEVTREKVASVLTEVKDELQQEEDYKSELAKVEEYLRSNGDQDNGI
jgi:hypothetical protein